MIFRDGDCRSLYQAGPFLGVVSDIALEAIDVELAARSRVLLFSDGLEEQWNASDEEFGMARVEHAIGDSSRDLGGAVDHLVAEWTAFLSGKRPDDDATLIAIEYLE